MHLKSLTLRGFKSFASSTTLRFEPGITCVVGPNGSGKSNVVDALAWVMGEQGAKSLRGGKMEDVIFAGTSGRPPLGRAEVLLTIDNSDGQLPIDYAEVTLSRIMFRNGGSEYAINGESCRLLDVQELLSDSGIGREMHVIVGQGQLDQILSATPEDRRGFIEEAAGVLKHRKRKEKALRKLEAMQANMTRVSDLTAELRRQLKPLGKQAEVARRASVVQADLRDARLRLMADDLLVLRTALEQEVADETALRERRAQVEAALATAQAREAELEAAAAERAPAVARAQEVWYRLNGVRERLRGTAGMADQRLRILATEPEDDRPGRDPVELDAAAARVRAEEAALVAEVEQDRERLAAAVAVRTAAEDELVAEERRVASAERAHADRREGLARLVGQVGAARTRLETREAEIGRLATALEEARERARVAHEEFVALESRVAGLDEGEIGLDTEHEQAAAAYEAAQGQVVQLRQEEREAERDRAALTARKEALELSLARKDGSAALLAAGDRLSGVLGSVAALVTVRPGYEAALAAALGTAADAVAVDGLDAAVGALRLLKDDDAGRAPLLVGSDARSDRPGGAGRTSGRRGRRAGPGPGARARRGGGATGAGLDRGGGRPAGGPRGAPGASRAHGRDPGRRRAVGRLRARRARRRPRRCSRCAPPSTRRRSGWSPRRTGPSGCGSSWRRRSSSGRRRPTGARPRSRGCTSPTRGSPRWPSSSGSWGRRRGRRPARPTGCRRPSPPPTMRCGPTATRWTSCRSAWTRPSRSRPRSRRPPTVGTRSRSRRRQRGRPRSRPG